MGILRPIEIVVAWIMVKIHSGLTAIGLSETSGLGWVLSIVGLTVFIRVLLIPLFVKQINASRSMQLLQPDLKKLQEKYKGRTDPDSRQAMAREQMELYKHHGTNPFSSCLPILLQMPIFFALFRVLNNLGKIASGAHEPIGLVTQDVARQIEDSVFLGARMSDTFMGAGGSVKLLCLVMIVLMSGATFYSQKMLMSKNMPASAMENNPFLQQQKIMLYLFPLIFAVSGVSFPVGVLIYWLTSNVWTAGQQFYVIHRMPAPGSQAERELNARRAARGKPPVAHPRKKPADGSVSLAKTDAAEGSDVPRQGGQRQQPKRKGRKGADNRQRAQQKQSGESADADDAGDAGDGGGD